MNVFLTQPNPIESHIETQDPLSHNPNTDKPRNST
jgi:hypothetical protein